MPSLDLSQMRAWDTDCTAGLQKGLPLPQEQKVRVCFPLAASRRGLRSLWSHSSRLLVASGCHIGQDDGGHFRPCRKFTRPCCSRPAQSWGSVQSPRRQGSALPTVSRLLAGADELIQGQAVFGPGTGCFISRKGIAGCEEAIAGFSGQ